MAKKYRKIQSTGYKHARFLGGSLYRIGELLYRVDKKTMELVEVVPIDMTPLPLPIKRIAAVVAGEGKIVRHCHNCGKAGHRKDFCPKEKENGYPGENKEASEFFCDCGHKFKSKQDLSGRKCMKCSDDCILREN